MGNQIDNWPKLRPPCSPTSSHASLKMCRCHDRLGTSWEYMRGVAVTRRPKSIPLNLSLQNCWASPVYYPISATSLFIITIILECLTWEVLAWQTFHKKECNCHRWTALAQRYMWNLLFLFSLCVTSCANCSVETRNVDFKDSCTHLH